MADRKGIWSCEHVEIVATRGQGERILVVEDEATLRKLFGRMIESLGYQVQTAVDGNEALLMVAQNGLRPDLVITDVVMPGMGGKALAERLARILPDLKVLYVSGYTDNAIIHPGCSIPRHSSSKNLSVAAALPRRSVKCWIHDTSAFLEMVIGLSQFRDPGKSFSCRASGPCRAWVIPAGFQFYLFVVQAGGDDPVTIQRPAGMEGLLAIGDH